MRVLARLACKGQCRILLKSQPDRILANVVCQAIGLETGSAAQDYSQLYELSESLEYIQQTTTRILNSIGAEGSSAPPA